jgi:hypothetical protein
MKKEELMKKVEPIIELFAIGKEFKVTELFDPVIWMSFTSQNQKEISVMFSKLVDVELKDSVDIKINDTDLMLQLYWKIGKTNIKKEKNIFPNEPVSIKRNERGNA